MSRYSYVIILLGALFSSCSKEETGVGERIAFDVAVGVNSTKSSSTYSGGTFGTYAWKTNAVWSASDTTSNLATPYMANAQTTKTEDKWYPGSFCWPSSESYLHFACYAPYTVTSPMTYSIKNGICFNGYTIDYSGTQDDLLYSDLSKDNLSTSTPDCAIAFHHALCLVKVNLQTDGIPSGLTDVVKSTSVSLKSLSVSGLRTTGNFKQNSTPQWSGQSGTASYTIFSGELALTTSKNESCPEFYVLPQSFETGTQAINLTYDTSLTYSDNSVKSKTDISETFYLSERSLTNVWAPGKLVEYTITVSAFGDVISFSANTFNWDVQNIPGNLGGGIK